MIIFSKKFCVIRWHCFIFLEISLGLFLVGKTAGVCFCIQSIVVVFIEVCEENRHTEMESEKEEYFQITVAFLL